MSSKKEIIFFEDEGIIGVNLQHVYGRPNSTAPASTENERLFPAADQIVLKSGPL